MRDKVKLPSVGSFVYPHGWLGEPIGHLLAVDHTLIHIYFTLSLEVGGLLPVICGIKHNPIFQYSNSILTLINIQSILKIYYKLG